MQIFKNENTHITVFVNCRIFIANVHNGKVISYHLCIYDFVKKILQLKSNRQLHVFFDLYINVIKIISEFLFF